MKSSQLIRCGIHVAKLMHQYGQEHQCEHRDENCPFGLSHRHVMKGGEAERASQSALNCSLIARVLNAS